MNIRHRVELNQLECEQLSALLSGGRHLARRLKRAQILLAANEGVTRGYHHDCEYQGSTVYCTKRPLVGANLDGALSEEPRPGPNYGPVGSFWDEDE